MPSYYELLKINDSATQEEIEVRLDDQYTKWRSLVTHHDSEVVSQANQALKLLEEIRSVLLNPEKRETYDLAMKSEQEGIGGLADPDSFLSSNPMPTSYAPPRRRVDIDPASVNTRDSRTDAWICPDNKCGKANLIGTQFCAKCGKTIGANCPKCDVISELSNKFCTNCGVVKEEYFNLVQKDLIKELQREINATRKEIVDGEANYRKIVKSNPGRFKFNKWGCGYNIVTGIILLVIIVISIGNESWAIFNILMLIFIAVSLVYQYSVTKNKVQDYLNDELKPRIHSLEKEIKRAQKIRYGD
jgi:hypothetical protein